MNVLMIGNIASTGWNLTKGLRNNSVNVIFVGNKNKCTDGNYDYSLSWHDFLRKGYSKKYFDIIHINSPNFKKLGLVWKYLTNYGIFFKETKLICHWHGSDLRILRKTFPVSWLLKKIGNYHLYSTIDLAWWLRHVDKSKKQHFICPVDTDLFKPNNNIKQNLLILSNGGKTKYPILHKKMPNFMNQYKSVIIKPSHSLSEKLLQVSMLEGASCNLDVLNHTWLNREWVIKHASIESQTKKLITIYKKVLKK